MPADDCPAGGSGFAMTVTPGSPRDVNVDILFALSVVGPEQADELLPIWAERLALVPIVEAIFGMAGNGQDPVNAPAIPGEQGVSAV